MLDRVAGLLQHAPVHGKPRSLDRKDEAVRHFACPFAKSRGRLSAIEGAVDLDRGEALAGVGKLLRVRQPFRIEHAAPGLVGPSADANTDFRRFVNAHRRAALKKPEVAPIIFRMVMSSGNAPSL